jgi:HEAT repeat protein
MRLIRFGLAVSLVLTLSVLTSAQVDKAREKEKGKENPKELSRGSMFGGKNLDGWIAMLKSKDPSARENAIATLKLYGPVAREAIPILIGLTKDKDVSIRVNTAIAMGLIGMDDRDMQEGVAALMRLLNNETQAIVRYQAALALSRLGPDAKAAIPSLINALTIDRYSSSHSWEIRRAAAAALGAVAVDNKAGPDPRASLSLIKAFTDDSAQVRLEAILAEIVLGPPTKPGDKLTVERAIVGRHSDPDKHVAIWAHMASMRMDKVSEQHLAAIAKFLKNEEPTVRAHVGRALGTVGPDAKSRLPELIEALQVEDDPSTIYWTVFAMVQLGDPAPRAIKALEDLQKHKNPHISQMASDAIQMLKSGKMGKEPEKPKGK